MTASIVKNSEDYDAHFDMAVCELARHDVDAAMVHLFYIQERQAGYKDGAAREMIISVVNTLGIKNPEMAQLYRKQLSNLLNA